MAVPSPKILDHSSILDQSSESSDELFRYICRSLFAYQRKNRYVSSAWGELSINEQQLLAELDRPEPSQVSHLAKRLLLPEASISQLLHALCERSLITKLKGFRSKREGFYHLTSAGKEISERIDQIGNHVAFAYSSNTPREGQIKLLRFWRILSDLLSAAPSNSRAGEHPLRVEIRRLTRVLRITQRNAFSQGVTLSTLHVLDAIRCYGAMAITDLTNTAHLSSSAVVRALERLVSEGLIEKHKVSKKNNKLQALITPKGEALLEEVEQMLIERFKTYSSPSLEAKLREGLRYHLEALKQDGYFAPEEGISPTLSSRPQEQYYEELMAESLLMDTAHRIGTTYRYLEQTLSDDTSTQLWYFGSVLIAMICYGKTEHGVKVFASGLHRKWTCSEHLRKSVGSFLLSQAAEGRSSQLEFYGANASFRELMKIPEIKNSVSLDEIDP